MTTRQLIPACLRLAAIATITLATGIFTNARAATALGSVANVVTGYTHSCAVTTSGALLCWGENATSQLGTSAVSQSSVAIGVPGLASGVRQVALGAEHTCALMTNGSVKCWGGNTFGQVGTGAASSNVTAPTDVATLSSGVIYLSAGAWHTCALTDTNAVKCWGRNQDGQTGTNSISTFVAAPSQVFGLTSGVAMISSGGFYTCAQMMSGAVNCWGDNYWGYFGNGTYTDSSSPTPSSALQNVLSPATLHPMSAGYFNNCVLTGSSGVKCFGDNSHGQLGVATPGGIATPLDVPAWPSGITEVATASNFVCVRVSSAVQCIGDNTAGQLGTGTVGSAFNATPANVTNLTEGVSQISATNSHACALTTSGAVKCWGSGGSGQLGNNATATSATPVTVLSSEPTALNLPIVFEEYFDGPALDNAKWQVAIQDARGNAATTTFANGRMNVTVPGGSSGFNGVADGSKFTPQNLSLTGDFEVALTGEELLRQQLNGNRDNSGIRIVAGTVNVDISGNYSGYWNALPYATYNKHRIVAYNGSTTCYLDESLSLTGLYTFELRIRRIGGAVTILARYGSGAWSEASCGSLSGSISPQIFANSGDGGYTNTNGKLVAAFDSFVVRGSAVINGVCGPAANVATANAPTGNTNLCAAGTPSAVVTGATNFTWTCSGTNGGNPASCSATATVVSATNITPRVVTQYQPTTFVVTGQNLPGTSAFSFEGCAAKEELVNSNANRRRFSCTPLVAGAAFSISLNVNGNQVVTPLTIDVLSDADRDGIPDAWENSGVPTVGGAKYLIETAPDDPALAPRGGDQRDLYLWLDEMNCDFEPLRVTVLRKIVDIFSRRGIQLHIFRSSTGGAIDGVPTSARMLSCEKDVVVTELNFSEVTNAWKSKNFLAGVNGPARARVFHYVIYGYSYSWNGATSSTGVTSTPDNTTFVAGANTSSEDKQLGTLLHEFGHLLGLDHNGPVKRKVGDEWVPNSKAVFGLNYKPAYLSTMNYLFQLPGRVTSGARFDFTDEVTHRQWDEHDLLNARLPSGIGTRIVCSDGNDHTQGSFTSLYYKLFSETVESNETIAAALVRLGCTPTPSGNIDGNAITDDAVTTNSTGADWPNLDFAAAFGIGVAQGAEIGDLPVSYRPDDLQSSRADELRREVETPPEIGPSVNITSNIVYNKAAAGGQAVFLVSVKYQGTGTKVFAVSKSPSSWQVTGIPPTLSIQNGATISFPMVVTVPPGVANGLNDRVDITIAATDSNAVVQDTVSLFTVVSLDTDNDGIPDAVEAAGPNNGDANGDGIPDKDQKNVGTIFSPAGNGYVTFEVSGGCTVAEAISAYTESQMAAQDLNWAYPLGLVSFRLPCTSASVKLYYHGVSSLTGYTMRRYGPTVPGNAASAAWSSVPGVTFGTATIAGNTVATASYTLRDGQPGDDTGTDGTIVDPVGPALFVGGPVDANGNPIPVPATDRSGLILITLMLLLAGGLSYRRQRRRWQ